MFTAHFTSAGGLRRDCIITSESGNTRLRTNYSAYLNIVWNVKAVFFSGALMMYSWCLIRGIPLSEEKMLKNCKELKILASSNKAGLYAISTQNGKQIFITGHSEYDADTLKNEYVRDHNAGVMTALPEHYFRNDDDTQPPIVSWRSHANLIYSNWLNYFVYQTTPYELNRIGKEREDNENEDQ